MPLLPLIHLYSRYIPVFTKKKNTPLQMALQLQRCTANSQLQYTLYCKTRPCFCSHSCNRVAYSSSDSCLVVGASPTFSGSPSAGAGGRIASNSESSSARRAACSARSFSSQAACSALVVGLRRRSAGRSLVMTSSRPCSMNHARAFVRQEVQPVEFLRVAM